MGMFVRYLLALAWLVCTGFAQAGVIINTTRVIFPEAEGETTLQLRNKGKGPVLAQLWIDDGDVRAQLSELDVPFALTPVVARIDADRGQAVRILQTRKDLPTDRESLFWFNLLEIPPKPTQKLAQGDNLLQFSLRTRIKMFYRPSGLPGTANQAHEQLRFMLEHAAADGARRLRVVNPTPYHITFSGLQLRATAQAPVWAELGKVDSRMVAPMAELQLPLTLQATAGALPPQTRVFYGVINDYGGETLGQQELGGADAQ
jgi:chaperone protein EcpD